MRSKLLARLERLEARTGPKIPPTFRYGWLVPLPGDYSGERHVVVVKREPTGSPGVEWCQFEEREGPGPKVDTDECFTVLLTRDTDNNTTTELSGTAAE